MTTKPTTLIEELVRAGRGVAGLVVGDRRASAYFDFSMRGLYGSFIAYLLILAFNAGAPMALGAEGAGGAALRTVLSNGLLYASQVAACALALRQLDRRDGLVPYIVANNWATLFFMLAGLLAAFSGGLGIAMLVLAILVLVVEVNIARVVIGLSGMKVALFIVAQLVGGGFGLLLVSLIYPPMGAELAAFQ